MFAYIGDACTMQLVFEISPVMISPVGSLSALSRSRQPCLPLAPCMSMLAKQAWRPDTVPFEEWT